jgi:hypothetical protein
MNGGPRGRNRFERLTILETAGIIVLVVAVAVIIGFFLEWIPQP